MSGTSPSRQFRQTLFVGVLCLLAVLFAVEAKRAWYSPANGPDYDVRSAKAYPATTPEVIARGVSTLNSELRLISFALVVAFAVASTIQMNYLPGHRVEGDSHPHLLLASPSTNLFVRPPPTL